MKLIITFASLLIAVTEPVYAGEVVVQRMRTSLALQVANNAFNACANAFVARVFPGQEVKFRSELNVDTRTAEAAGGYDNLRITMQARLKRDDSQLARGSCEVRRNGQITSLSVGTTPGAKLVGLTTGDIKLAMVSR